MMCPECLVRPATNGKPGTECADRECSSCLMCRGCSRRVLGRLAIGMLYSLANSQVDGPTLIADLRLSECDWRVVTIRVAAIAWGTATQLYEDQAMDWLNDELRRRNRE